MSPDSIPVLLSTIKRRGRTSSGGTNIFFFPLRFKREILPLLQSWKSAPFSICHLGLSYQTLLVLLWELTCLFTETQRQSSSTTPAFPSTSPSLLRQILPALFSGEGGGHLTSFPAWQKTFPATFALVTALWKITYIPPKEQYYFSRVFFCLFACWGFLYFFFLKRVTSPISACN